MIFIGLSGKKRVGKNTVASQLKLLTNQTIDEFAFAYPLKVEAAKMLGVNVAYETPNLESFKEDPIQTEEKEENLGDFDPSLN